MAAVHDELIGTGLKCGGALKKTMTKHGGRLRSELVKLKVKAGVREAKDLLPKSMQKRNRPPRYARVNEIRHTAAEVSAGLVEAGFTQVATPDDPSTMDPGTFALDRHLHDLLVFAPGTNLRDSSFYRDGVLILQDKPSCFPAHVLDPDPGADAVDACAAPGNKTGHLAALLRNTGTIFAFDTDSRRLELLKARHKQAGVTNVSSSYPPTHLKRAPLVPSCRGFTCEHSSVYSRARPTLPPQRLAPDHHHHFFSVFAASRRKKTDANVLVIPCRGRVVYEVFVHVTL